MKNFIVNKRQYAEVNAGAAIDVTIPALEAENQRLRDELDRERMVTRDILAHSKNDCDTLKTELDALKEVVRFMDDDTEGEIWNACVRFRDYAVTASEEHKAHAATLLRVLDE